MCWRPGGAAWWAGLALGAWLWRKDGVGRWLGIHLRTFVSAIPSARNSIPRLTPPHLGLPPWVSPSLEFPFPPPTLGTVIGSCYTFFIGLAALQREHVRFYFA